MRLALALLLLCLLAGTAAAHAQEAGSGGTQELRQADFVIEETPSPPGDDAPWQAQELPDAWRESRPATDAESAWYRFRFAGQPNDKTLQGIYLPKLIMNARIYLNGIEIGDGGHFSEPVARNWNRPLLFLFPPGLLRAGENTLHIHLRGHAYTQTALSPPRIGPERLLRDAYERAYFLNITVNQTATLLISSIGILMLSLWMRRRQDSAYAYFGAAALVWALQSTNLYIRDIPVTTASWEILINGGFQVFSGLLLISLLRFVASSNRVMVSLLWASILLSPLSLWLVPAGHYFAATSFWHLYTLLCLVATLLLLLRAAIMKNNREARYLVAAMSIVFVLALHDWLIHSQHIWQGRALVQWPLNDVFLLHYSAPVIFLSIGLIMTGRFVRVLNEFEGLNDQLEERVNAKQVELQASHLRLRLLETEHAVAEERERIYRDLHDDVGAKLLSLVYRSATTEDAELARSALQDLRDVVSRSSSGSFDLDEVVADWRAECERRLADAGLRLEWRQPDNREELRLSQPQALNLGRILREAVSNTIRHARATQVCVELSLSETQLQLAIQDDGHGCLPMTSGKPSGRGMRNMEMRAAKLGGALQHGNLHPQGYAVITNIPRNQLQ